ncbi:MAG: hypothetical protein KKF24_17060 [Gammaproteobacteria bacterium]|nr:hypothetical protein [Gammaproteobacteria bacterium]MBU1834396.1 hypothetical protein [Gammaproteobacteria bacterium]
MKLAVFLQILLLCLFGLGGCATEMSEKLYVYNSEQSDPVITAALHGETLAQRLPNSKERITFNERLIGSLEKNGEIFSVAHFGRGYESKYGFKTETSKLKLKGLIDVAVEVDMRNSVPLYRFVLTPQHTIKSKHVDRWAPIVRVNIEIEYGRNKSFSLFAPLPEGERLKNGQIITPWVYCGRCFINDSSYALNDDDEYFRLYKERITWLMQKVNYKRPIKSARGLSFINGDTPALKNKGIAEWAVGTDQAEAARQAFIADYADYNTRVEQAKLANQAYDFFINNKYAPLTMWKQFRNSDCPKYMAGANTNQAPDYNRKLIRQNQDFIRCAERVVDSYNFEAFVLAYPDLVEREQVLWEKTYGIERQTIDDVDGQLQYAKDNINGAYNGIEEIQSYINIKEEGYAKEKRQREMTMATLNNFRQKYNAMTVESRNKQVIVSPDGRVSTVGKERERAIEQGRMQAYLDKNKKTKVQKRPNVNNKQVPSRSPDSASTKEASQSAGSGSSSDSSPQSKNLEPDNAPGIDDGSNTPANQTLDQRMENLNSQIAKKEMQEKELQQQLEDRKAREFGIATARAEGKQQNVVAISGGMNGCVELLEVKRYPGKSPFSSCSYDQPERLSTGFRFRNSCELPVDVHIDIDYDNDSSKPSAEYNIKPGKARTTVSHCGLSDYSYTYKETGESVRRRSK